MALVTLLAVWAVALVLALVTLNLIVRPLFQILIEICGGRDRARFWTIYACVLTLAAPLFTVSMPGLLDSVATTGNTGAVLQRAVFYALAGIVGALLIMGHAVWHPIFLMLRARGTSTRRDDES